MPGGTHWVSEEGSITIGGTDYTAEIKDINFSGATREVELIRTFGVNNEYGQENPAEIVEIGFTAVTRDADFWTHFLGGKLTAANVGSSFEDYPRTRRDVVFTLNDNAGKQIQISALSAWGISADATLSIPGHFEQTATFKCLPKHFTVLGSPV